MSHLTVSAPATFDDTQVLLEAFALAAQKLDLEFVPNKQTYVWYGRWMNDWDSETAAANRIDPERFGKCSHVFTLPIAVRQSIESDTNKAYEIGVLLNPDNTYQLIWDCWSGGLGTAELKERVEDDSASKLSQTITAVMPEAKKNVATRNHVEALKRLGYENVTTIKTETGAYEIIASFPKKHVSVSSGSSGLSSGGLK